MRRRRSSRTPRRSGRSRVRGGFPPGAPPGAPWGQGQPRDTWMSGNPNIRVCSVPDFLPSEEDLQGKTEEEIEMMKMMGFASFDTTKGKKVDGAANAYAINVSQKRKYRQYMNRKGGFNRPLDFIA
uniref:U4/U6.U5 small nuclear ribonucleoprotein 27 kDa protein n=1 Tax=Serinus canaria TaxID=9135 RepID=A0A8C9NRC7_SERCA